MKKKAEDFGSIVQSLTRAYEVVKDETGPHKKIVWYLDHEDDIKGKCCEIIRQSEEEVTVLTNEDGLTIVFNCAHRLLDEVQERGVEVNLYSPLDPKTNPLARELSYIFKVGQVEVETPVLFINSDRRRFLLAKVGPTYVETPFETAIFSDDKALLSLVCLLLMDRRKKTLLKPTLV